MNEGGHRAVAEAARLVAMEARREASDLDEHRAALGRSALVWWQGGAAERYQQLVRERVNALAEVAQHLEALAGLADLFAAALEREADTEAALGGIGAPSPVVRR
jgi:hypothetical protein